jgi:hypothetical protein
MFYSICHSNVVRIFCNRLVVSNYYSAITLGSIQAKQHIPRTLQLVVEYPSIQWVFCISACLVGVDCRFVS